MSTRFKNCCFKQGAPYITITLTVESLKTRKDFHSQISPHSPTSSLKTEQSHCDACGGSYFFYLFFFLPPPAPGPMLSKTLKFVHVIVRLYPNIE